MRSGETATLCAMRREELVEPSTTITSRVLPAQRHAYKVDVPRRADRGWSRGARTGSGGSMQASCALPCSDGASDSSPSGAPSPGPAWRRVRAAHVATPRTSPGSATPLHVPPLGSPMTEAGRASRSARPSGALRMRLHLQAPRGAAPARRPLPQRACHAAARAARARAAPPRTGAAAPAGRARTARRGVRGVRRRSVAEPGMQRQRI